MRRIPAVAVLALALPWLAPAGCHMQQDANMQPSPSAQSLVFHCDFDSDPAQAGWRACPETARPFEGAWVDLGGGQGHSITVRHGCWESPTFDVQPFRYYRLVFRAKAEAQGYWAVLFQDAQGQTVQTDVYDSLWPSADWQDQEFCFRAYALATRAFLRFQPIGSAVAVTRVSLNETSSAAAAAWATRLYRQGPPLAYVPPADRGALLPRTLQRLREGGVWRIVVLGDSVANDTGNSLFEVLLRERFPQAEVAVVNSVRSGTGCTWYQHEDRVRDFVLRFHPDLLIIAGISHAYDAEAYRSVIRQVRAQQSPEILVLSDCVTPQSLMAESFTKTSGLSAEAAADTIRQFPQRLRRMAAEERVEYLDLRGAWEDYVRSSHQALDWFLRDPIHANSRGKQVLGQILARYLAPDGA